MITYFLLSFTALTAWPTQSCLPFSTRKSSSLPGGEFQPLILYCGIHALLTSSFSSLFHSFLLSYHVRLDT